eukprot:GAHX01000073.1.p1 GENE.GAHX01000073.1~~GAHX01000073.1.p1  ORF type:complete len:127 (+),score=32.15 GAHX01000073.1:46-381(+)
MENFEIFNDEDTTSNTIDGKKHNSKIITLRINQRNARKYITIVEGLTFLKKEEIKELLSKIKRKLSTNGTIVQSEEFGVVLQLQGDLRKKLTKFLLESKYCNKDEIVTKGF